MMDIVESLNRRYPHPNTLVFDETVLIEIAAMMLFLILGVVGLVFYWPLAAIGLGSFAVLCIIAWKDFGKHLMESIKYYRRSRRKVNGLGAEAPIFPTTSREFVTEVIVVSNVIPCQEWNTNREST
jgi:hypothetical protein